MAYFVVIGTDNKVIMVVDEIRESHLQHNVVTSGCIIDKEDSLFYHWDVYNAGGEKKNEDEKPSISLRDALTNQIAQFRALMPDGSVPNVFIIGSCYTKDDANRVKFVYDALCEIGGATFGGLSIDVVLLGYNLAQSHDVTLTPNWKDLKNFEGIENGKFHTDVLYINNMDYDGAATNVDARLLGRFLGHWAKILNSGNVDPKQTVSESYYAIGLAERQYNFEDLVPFFKLAAEERIHDRALHNSPSSSTRQMLDTKYFNRIDLGKPWIDGLCSIKADWDKYCTTPFDYLKEIVEQPYSLSLQKKKLEVYLNNWLAIFCNQQHRDIDLINSKIEGLEQVIAELESNLPVTKDIDSETGEEVESESEKKLKEEIAHKKAEIDNCKQEIRIHEQNIESNTFADARLIKSDFEIGCLTDSQKSTYESHLESEAALGKYLHSDNGVNVINDTIKRAIGEGDETPDFPSEVIDNVGRLEELSFVSETIEETPTPIEPAAPSTERKGCLFGWFHNLFHKKEDAAIEETVEDITEGLPKVDVKDVLRQVTNAIKEYRRIKDVEVWWQELITLVNQKEERQKQCLLEMDGVVCNKGTSHEYREGGFQVPFHRKSISIISVDKAREYRDSNDSYLRMVEILKERYFDSNIETDKRQSMQQLIKHQVIDALRGVWHTLHWDGKNPFCNEMFTPEDIHAFIEDLENGIHKQSKPFVEYVKLETQNVTQNINYLIYFSHPKIERQPNTFRDTYKVSEGSLSPVYLPELTNSLCEVQVLDVSDHVDSLADFVPRTETQLHESRIKYADYVRDVVGNAHTKVEKARAIYNWLCENISYDTTYQIHDADTCWRTRRGVCQAYCELFVHFARLVGVTAEIVTGKSKNAKGEISDKDHAWIFVYTHGYKGIFIDPTWGAGAIDGKKFVKSDDNTTWFDVSPYWLIFNHFPDQQYWTKLDIEISEEQFRKLPYTNPLRDSDGMDYLFESLASIS